MFSVHNIWILFDGSVFQCGLDAKNFNVLIVSIIILFISDCFKYKNIEIKSIIMKQDYIVKTLVVIAFVMFILIFGIWGFGYNQSNFVYFQF